MIRRLLSLPVLGVQVVGFLLWESAIALSRDAYNFVRRGNAR
jgi:hypothetical protein